MGLLGDPTDPATKADRMALGPLANALGLTFVSADAESPTDFDAAVTKLINERVDAMTFESDLSPYAPDSDDDEDEFPPVAH